MRTMTQQRRLNLVAVSLGALLAGCITGPQPFPLPAPNSKVIYLSNPGLTERAVATGLPGAAVAGGGGIEIVVTAAPSGLSARGLVSSDGSFSLWLGVRTKDTLTAHLERDGEQGDGVTLPWSAETPNDGPFVIRSVSRVAAGVTTVQGGYQAGRQVLIGNLRSGAVVTTTVDGAGNFSATLAATPGDRLSAFTLDPSTKRTGEALEAIVPP